MVPVIFTEVTTRVAVDAAGGWPNTKVIFERDTSKSMPTNRDNHTSLSAIHSTPDNVVDHISLYYNIGATIYASRKFFVWISEVGH
jgi:hypothetical protein